MQDPDRRTQGARLASAHLSLLLEIPTTIYGEKHGAMDEAIGTPQEACLVALESAGFISLKRPEPTMIDVKLTKFGLKALEILWDYQAKAARATNASGRAPLPRVSTVFMKLRSAA